jgi:hypothetical protein
MNNTSSDNNNNSNANPTTATMSINNLINPSNTNANNTNYETNNSTEAGIFVTNSMTSPPRRPSNNNVPPQLPDPLATPRSFLRNNSASATPSLIATPPPPFKYPLPHSPYYDARTSLGSNSSSSTNLKMEDKLRYWRHDAYLKNLYETAAFWGNKVVSITGNFPTVFILFSN